MAANIEFHRSKELSWLRGFANLLRKENRSWWSTRRWWINALLWPGMLGGLVGLMIFVVPTIAAQTGDPAVDAAGGLLPFALQLGRMAFFEMGTIVLAIGVVVLCQDLIIEEKQSGVVEWLLTKPVARRSYVLAKLAASAGTVLVLLISLPALVTYLMLSIRLRAPFPPLPFLGGVGILSAHTLFYLTLTLMLGTLYTSRAPILGFALGLLLSGNFLSGLLKPLVFVTPWMLAKVASLVVDAQPVPASLLWSPLTASLLWSAVFIFMALAKFENTEF